MRERVTARPKPSTLRWVKQVTGTSAFTLEEAMVRLAAIERRLAVVEAQLAELRGDPVDLREMGNVGERT